MVVPSRYIIYETTVTQISPVKGVDFRNSQLQSNFDIVNYT